MKSRINVSLSKDLRKKYGISHFPIIKGDIVVVKSGSRKTEGGKVDSVDHVHSTLVVDGVTVAKADGKQKEKPVKPNQIVITRLDLSKPERLERIREMAKRRNKVIVEEPPVETPSELPEPSAEPALPENETTEIEDQEEKSESVQETEENKEGEDTDN
jgi:large subunit ribosomal protein L24